MTFSVFAVLLSVTPLLVPEAWRIATDSNAAARAIHDYQNNVVRARWAGDAKGLAAAYPANITFALPIAGSEQSVSNVQRILEATIAAIPADTRAYLEANRRLAPMVDWLVRLSRPGVTNETSYLAPWNLTAVFTEKDFVLENLTNLAVRLRPGSEPAFVDLDWKGEYRGWRRLPEAEPVLDYPDFRPETQFAAPYVRSLVVRAPEGQREFRVRATTQYKGEKNIEYKWISPTGKSPAFPWQWSTPYKPEAGYGRIELRRWQLSGRTDVYVVAKRKGGFWGPPSIISFYSYPGEKRTYSSERRVLSVSCAPTVRPLVPYSIASIILPYDWTDYYLYDDKHRNFGYERGFVTFPKKELFSAIGERVLECHPNDLPKVSIKVRYFERDGKLAYEDVGEEITHKASTFQPRR